MAAAAKYDWETIRAEYEAGANQSDLSGRHGVSRGAVRKHIAAEGWTRNSSGTVSRMAEDRAAGCDPEEGAEALNRAAQGVAVVMMRHKAEWERHQCLIDEAMETGDPDKAKFAKITAEALKIRQEGERRAWGIVESDVRPAAARKTEQDAIRQGIREAFLSVGMGRRFVLTPRWYRLRPHAGQHELWHSKARFIVLPCGRRSGKSEIARRKLILSALDPDTGYDDPNYFAAAPTRDQAKRIYWRDLKALLPEMLVGKVSESEMLIRLVNGASVYVIGMDKPERIEGMSWNGGILDEYANMKPGAWPENVRPALSDRAGWCWLIGVPEGRNHYYDLYRYAMSEESGEEWAAFSWKSSEILPEEEIASARAALDELTFQQEYEASFITFEGRCYYPFLRETHCAGLRHLYNPRAPLVFCFDFNVDPGVACVCQEMKLPNGQEGTAVIGEVYIPRNSCTPAVCRKLIQDWGGHEGAVICYGDAAGGSRGSAKVAGSDWDLIKAEFRQSLPGRRMTYRVPSVNPPERSRVNAVNSRLKSESGDVRLMVDPQAAPHVAKDLEGVALLKGGSGEIDKKAAPELTHISDALGYYIAAEFPVQGRPKTAIHHISASRTIYYG